MAKMIYDCFAFFNELDILDLRLRELYDAVDKFVLVEATRTFQKQPKPLYYAENKERYKEFNDKIIHVVVDRYPNFFSKWRVPKPWDYDNHQKEFILDGLKEADDDDLIIVSDVDEIPLADKVREYKDQPGIRVFEQYLSFYYMNNVCTYFNGESEKSHSIKNKNGYGFWRGSIMLEKKLIKTIKKTRLYRDQEGSHITVIKNGGWHMSYIGDVQHIIKKVESWAHKELNIPKYKSPENVLKAIKEGYSLFDPKTKFKIEKLNETDLPFPKALVENTERFKDHLL